METSGQVYADEILAVADEALNKSWLGIPRRKNILLFSPQAIRPDLLDRFPRIDSADIRRESLHTISIAVKERVPVGLWCFPAKARCYYFDDSGVAFAEISSSSGFLFVAVNDWRDREITLGETIAPEDWRTHILEIKKILQFGGIAVEYFEIPADSRDEFTAVTGEGWRIIYLNDNAVRKQTTSLLAFLKEKLPPDAKKTLDYVDLRIEDRIYYTQK